MRRSAILAVRLSTHELYMPYIEKGFRKDRAILDARAFLRRLSQCIPFHVGRMK